MDVTGYSDSGDYSTFGSVSDSTGTGQEETADSSSIEGIETEISDTSDYRTTEETTESFDEIGTLGISTRAISNSPYGMTPLQWQSLTLTQFTNLFYQKYNNMIRDYATEINRVGSGLSDVSAGVRRLDSMYTALREANSSSFKNMSARIDSAVSSIQTNNNHILKLYESAASANTNILNLYDENVKRKNEIADLQTASKSNNNNILKLYSLSNETNTKIDGVKSWVNSHVLQLYESAASANTNILNLYDENVKRKNEIADLQTASKSNNNNILKLYSLSNETNTKIDGVKNWANSHILQLYESAASSNTNILNLYDENVKRKNEIADLQTASVTNNNNILKLYSLSNETNTKVDGVKAWANSHILQLYEGVASAETNLKDLNSENVKRKNEIADLQTASKTNNDNILNIYELLNGMKWSDVGIIAAITGLHDTWKTSDPGGEFSNADGDAVQIIKGQTARLISFLSTYFANLTKSIEFQFDWYFKDGGVLWTWWTREMATTTAYMNIGFEDLGEWLGIISGQITTSNQNLATIIGWLKLIYEKPGATINVPPPTIIQTPFDFARLQDILENLEFGNIINEPGTNLWDVLKEAISSLGNLLGGAISELGETARAILDFLDGLIDDLIGLIVPDDTDFIREGFSGISDKFNVKFKVIIDLGSQVKSVFEPIPGDFLQAISFTFMGVQFIPDGSSLQLFVPQFRNAFAVFIWLSVAWFAYRKLTGQGDMINDN